MELRHLRYFVAVAEEGSVTVAAEKRLHTAQPSLSRQLRDLELEVGAQLFVRTSRGVELTEAGRAFLDHARLALAQAAEAVAAARRAARPAKASFSVGFLTGQEVEWLSHVTHVLRDQLKDIDFRVTSDFSPAVAAAVQRGEIDIGFSRLEPQPDVVYKVIAHEPIVVVLSRDHALATRPEIDPRELNGVSFVGYADTPHVLRGVVERYLREHEVTVSPSHFLDGFATGISLVASTGGSRSFQPTWNRCCPALLSAGRSGDVPRQSRSPPATARTTRRPYLQASFGTSISSSLLTLRLGPRSCPKLPHEQRQRRRGPLLESLLFAPCAPNPTFSSRPRSR